MSEFDYVTKDFIKSNEFISDEPAINYERQEKSFRFRPGDKLPPTPEDLQLTLRKKISGIVATAFKDYGEIESRCYINKETIRSYLNGRRPINKYVIAKICVGAKLSIEQAQELFKLCGCIMCPKLYRFDAIVVNAIECKDEIVDFYETTHEYGFKDMWKKWDKLSRSQTI